MPIRFNPCSPCCIRVPLTFIYCPSRAFFNNLRDRIEGAKVELMANLVDPPYATYFSDSNGMVYLENLGIATRMRITLPEDGATYMYVMGGLSTATLTPADGSQAAMDAAIARNIFFYPAPEGAQCCLGATWIYKTKVLHAKMEGFIKPANCYCEDLYTPFTTEADLTWRERFIVRSQISGGVNLPIIINNCWVGKVNQDFGTIKTHLDCSTGPNSPINHGWIVFECDAITLYVNSTGNDGPDGNGPLLDGDPNGFIFTFNCGVLAGAALPSLINPFDKLPNHIVTNSLHPFYFRYTYPFAYNVPNEGGGGGFHSATVTQSVTISEAA